MTRICEAKAEGDQAVVVVDDMGIESTWHPIWLRDACTCPACRRPATNERLLDSTSIPLDLSASTVAVGDDGNALLLSFSDGHETVLSAAWLTDHLANADHRAAPAVGQQLWPTGSALTLPEFDHAELDEPDRLVAWIGSICDSGIALIRGVPPTMEGLFEMAHRVGAVRASNYGVTWEIEATVAPVSAVESERHLRVHTDLPYREVAPGVQFLLGSVADVAGGASTAVDGYAAAERVRAADPESWRLLSSVEFTYPYVRGTVEHQGRAPLIGLRPDGRYHQIRRAPDLVGVPFVDPEEVPALYRALRLWSAMLDDPAGEVEIRLEPGDLLAINNHRILHGRTAFELGAAGRRHLLGCYLDIEDLHSRRAVLSRSTRS